MNLSYYSNNVFIVYLYFAFIVVKTLNNKLENLNNSIVIHLFLYLFITSL